MAGDRQETNMTVLIVSTELARHSSSLSDIVSVPHPSPRMSNDVSCVLRAKDGAPADALGYASHGGVVTAIGRIDELRDSLPDLWSIGERTIAGH